MGLAAGTYTVHEARVPAGYVAAADFALVVGENGSVSVKGAGVSVVSGDGQTVAPERGNVVVRVTDQVFRAQVSLSKYFSHGGSHVAVPGMTFDLYRTDGTAGGTLVARSITTDASGSWSSAASDIAIERDASGASVLGDFYQKLSDGLPQGNYYLLETGTSELTQVSDARYDFAVGADDHAQTIAVNAENVEFNASAHLTKVDAETGGAIDDVEFELLYTPEGSTQQRSLGTIKTGQSYSFDATMSAVESSGVATSGSLTIAGLKKGGYVLVERANTGYKLDEANAPAASWTVGDDAQGGDFDLATSDAVTWVNASVEDGALKNVPLHGSVTMKKTDGNGAALAGATFSLQHKTADGAWEDDQSVVSGVDGSITVDDLPWGTYRFLETTPAPGYVGKGAATDEVTIARDNVAASIDTPLDLGSIANDETTFTIKKTSWDGVDALAGACYTVTPVSGSAFADGSAEKHLTTGTDGIAVPDTDDDVLMGNVIAGNSYVVTETQPPAGFMTPTPASLTVRVADDGTLVASGASNEAWAIEGSGLGCTVVVRDKAIDLRLQKVDEEGNPLGGSEFTLSGVFANGQDVRTVTPDAASGSCVLPNDMIEGQTYTLHESQPPVGYACVGDLTFRVSHASEGGARYEVVGDNPEGWSISEDGVTATATDKPVGFQVSKTDADGNPLKNAHFKIEGLFVDEDGNVSAAAQDAVTDETGLGGSFSCVAEGTHVTVDGVSRVANGLYQISETDAPYGYKLEDTVATVKIARDGTMTLLDGVSVAWSLGTADGVPTLALADTPVSITFSKLAEGSEQPLDGALFTIEGVFAAGDGGLANNGESQTLEGQTVDDLSALKFVAGQRYTISETSAPAGYELICGSVSFSVASDGTIQNFSAEGVSNGSFSVSGDGLSIAARDIPIRLTITKRSDGGKALFGARFTVTPQAGSAFADGSTDALEIVTDADGVAHLPGEVGDESLSAMLVAGNAYVLAETVSPAGYKLLEGSWAFSVNANGTITPAGSTVANGTIELEPSGDSLTVTDEVVPFGLVKYGERDAGGNAPLLAGAVFEVMPCEGSAFADAAALEAAGILEDGSARVTTGEDGCAGSELVDQLVVGNRYEIREVEAPAGYTLLPEALTVTVEPDGRLSCGAADRAEGFEVRGDGTIEVFEGKVFDSATQLAVRKVDADNALVALDGATYALAPGDGFTFADGTTEAREATTETVDGESGLATFDRALLRADGQSVYELREVRAPDGYALSDATLLFQVRTDGTIVPVRAGEDGFVELTEDELAELGFAMGESGVLVVAADKPVDLVLRKTNEAGETLVGATFTLSCAEGENDEGQANHFASGSTSDVLELEPDADGVLVSRELVVGNTYELEETVAPEGYVVSGGRVLVHVNDDGTVELVGRVMTDDESGMDVVDDDTAAWTVGEDGTSIALADPATRLRLAKTSSDGASARAMAGARFEVFGRFAGDDEASTLTLEVGEDGLAPELAGQFVCGERYTVREVKAPAGYQLLSGSFELVVRQDGSIASTGDVAGWSLSTDEDGVARLTATDDPVPPAPTTPGSNASATTDKAMPQTGDTTSQAFLALICAAGLGLIAMGIHRRRRP